MNCKLVLSPNEIHKIFPVPSTFHELNQIILNRLKLQSSPYKLKYKDGEDELITLNSEEDLQTAVLSCEADHLKTLKIYVLKRDLESSTKTQANIQPNNQKDVGYNGFKSRLWNKFSTHPTRKANYPEIYTKSENMDYQNVIKKCFTFPSCSPVSGSGFKMFEIEEEAASYSEGDEVSRYDNKVCKCDICGKQTRKAKYICLVCRDKMYCEDCEGSSGHSHPLLKLRQHMEPYYPSIFQKKEDGQSSGTSKKSGSSSNKSESSEAKIKNNYKVKVISQEKNVPLKVECGSAFTYSFVIKNNGKEQWPIGTQLVCINGVYRNKTENIPSLQPGEEYQVNFALQAPKESGRQLSQWRLHYKQEGALTGFGVSFFIETYNVRKNAKNNYEENKGESIESRKQEGSLFCPMEMESLRQIYKLAETLNEMFPGDIHTKVKFVEGCPRDYDIYKLVNEYLMTLRSRQ